MMVLLRFPFTPSLEGCSWATTSMLGRGLSSWELLSLNCKELSIQGRRGRCVLYWSAGGSKGEVRECRILLEDCCSDQMEWMRDCRILLQDCCSD